MSTHINAASKGDIAETVLLPGDPLRARFIAENFLENPRCYNEIRGNVRVHRNIQRRSCFRTGHRHGHAFHGNIFMGAHH